MLKRMVRRGGLAVGGLILCLSCNGVEPEQSERLRGLNGPR